jgi:glycosyltransferase involved in cell wall biosynthesis
MENNGSKLVEKNLVSIVLTYFNRKDFIMDQLNSILRQTYRNWQLIIIDDCSTDGSEEMLRKFIAANNDRKIEYIKNEKNLGLPKNFEKGLQFASGEFIAVCDSDDVWFEDKLEQQVNYLENSDAGMVYSDLVVVDEKLKTIRKSFIKSYLSFFSNQKNDTFEELINDNHITAPTILFRAELKDKLIPFSKYGMQDHWIAILCSVCSKIGFLNHPTVYYRQHSGNMIGTPNLSIYKLIFGKNKDFLNRHLKLKKNTLAYLTDLRDVKWMNEKYKNMISKKIRKTNILVECLMQFANNEFECRKYLKPLWKLGAYREIMQIIFFRFAFY